MIVLLAGWPHFTLFGGTSLSSKHGAHTRNDKAVNLDSKHTRNDKTINLDAGIVG